MSVFTGSSDIVLDFIKARKPNLLASKFAKRQAEDGMEYKIINITHDGEFHIAWFYVLKDLAEQLKEEINSKGENDVN